MYPECTSKLKPSLVSTCILNVSKILRMHFTDEHEKKNDIAVLLPTIFHAICQNTYFYITNYIWYIPGKLWHIISQIFIISSNNVEIKFILLLTIVLCLNFANTKVQNILATPQADPMGLFTKCKEDINLCSSPQIQRLRGQCLCFFIQRFLALGVCFLFN